MTSRGRRLVAAGTLLWITAAACRPAPSTTRVERALFLMGTVATLVVEAVDRETGVARLERMVRVIEETEAELSTWRDDSLLSALNRHPVGRWLPLPDRLCALLDQLGIWHRATGGAFDPAVGRLIDAWQVRDGGRVPASDLLAVARARSGFRHIAVDPVRGAASRRADVTLDAGGFGKGAALDRVRLSERGQAGAWLIDFGGQVAVSSPSADGAWPVAIAHPARREVPVAELRLAHGSIATSGGSERDLVLEAATRIGHIVDPRTGATVSRSSSVTVWHRDALAADVLSTALYVMEPDAAADWAEARGVAAYIVTADVTTGDVAPRATPAFAATFDLPPAARGAR